MENSIFRTEKIPFIEEATRSYDFASSTDSIIQNYRTHDDGIPRGREYSLDTIIKFSIFKGSSIKTIMEEDFDYFLWFGRKIENFTYDELVLEYAEKCLEIFINLEYPRIEKFPRLKYAKKQVGLMLNYENELDFGTDPISRDAWKSMIDVKFYKTIYNKLTEKMIRQSFSLSNYSNDCRRLYLNEIKNKR